MTTSNNMNPKNMLLLAGLGIGAYVLFTRTARAQTGTSAAPAWSQGPTRALTARQPTGATGLFNAAADLFSSWAGTKIADTMQASGENAVNDPAAYASSTYQDGYGIV